MSSQRLLDEVRAVMRKLHYSIHTERCYCDWIKRWIEIGLRVYGRLQRENPDYLDKLSALRGH